MSTKASIAYGNNFHLYHECFDEENVYLELEGIEFNASPNRVTVTIPVAIWETIRQHRVVDLSYADKSDEEIKIMVEEQVECKIKKYLAASEEKQQNFVSLSGSMCYGMVDLPRDEQIKKGMEYYFELRERQLTVKNQIEALKN